jgi:hypothetical protein
VTCLQNAAETPSACVPLSQKRVRPAMLLCLPLDVWMKGLGVGELKPSGTVQHPCSFSSTGVE